MIKTKAKTHQPPKHIFAATVEEYQLAFGADGKIDLYCVGDINSLPLDFNLLTLNMIEEMDPNLFRLTPTQALLNTKFKQLGLLFAITTRAKLVPGISRETDLQIIEKLRSTLSSNIQNPHEVIQEFISYWNEIADLAIAAKNLGKAPDFNPEHPPLFRYHEKYSMTVFAFCKQLTSSMMESEAFAKLIKKSTEQYGAQLTEWTVDKLKPRLTKMRSTALLNPISIEPTFSAQPSPPAFTPALETGKRHRDLEENARCLRNRSRDNHRESSELSRRSPSPQDRH